MLMMLCAGTRQECAYKVAKIGKMGGAQIRVKTDEGKKKRRNMCFVTIQEPQIRSLKILIATLSSLQTTARASKLSIIAQLQRAKQFRHGTMQLCNGVKHACFDCFGGEENVANVLWWATK